MADIANAAPKTVNLGRVLTAPFRAVGNALIAIAEAGPRAAQVRRLNALSDDQLAKLGTTRADEIRRIFAGNMYI